MMNVSSKISQEWPKEIKSIIQTFNLIGFLFIEIVKIGVLIIKYLDERATVTGHHDMIHFGQKIQKW